MNPTLMEFYKGREEQFRREIQCATKRLNVISLFRLSLVIIFITCLFYIQSHFALASFCSVLCYVCFILLMQQYSSTETKREFLRTLLLITTDEITALKYEPLPFYNGDEFKEPLHPYANDLDIFGNASLYQNLNRTATYSGRKILAETLLSGSSAEQILANQKAISELAFKPGWRAEIFAMAKMSHDSKQDYDHLMNWAATPAKAQGSFLHLISYLLPALTICSLLLYLFVADSIFLISTGTLFFMNLLTVMSQYTRIRAEIGTSKSVNKTVTQYSHIISHISKEGFTSERLNTLKAHFVINGRSVSTQVKAFAGLFVALGSINGSIGSVIMNGLFLRHIHLMRRLGNWKKNYADQIPLWLNVVGQFESLNSLANFYYNNSTFIFPDLNSDRLIAFSDLGHPLIRGSERITNSVKFEDGRFIILTGSNMSGKSTFLRTLGINMVLARIGSPICATGADIHPMKLHTAMRVSDSLSTGESYFFAEVKRLRQIIEAIENEVCFVLLDEILRGTNSDDKRTGTIAVIKKIISKGAIGVIATHDLDVCETAAEYPGTLVNMCFEVETVNNELVFDYKLRNGVCKNKSASYILQKMKVI